MAVRRVHIGGAGPAGLTAAYALCKRGGQPIVYERDTLVGGHARTESHRGFRFDIGGHRFFTRSSEVNAIWREMLGDRFMKVPRLSRICYDGAFFRYPLRVGNVVRGLGPLESARIVLSYCWATIRPHPREDNFEQWVTNRFGRRLYETFFKTYTEKVWGIPCTEISAEWAAQRIQGLSFRTAVTNALFGGNGVKSLIDEFEYPELGPGMMWETMSRWVQEQGGEVHLGREVVKVHRSGSRIAAITTAGEGGSETVEVDAFVSSLPLGVMLAGMDPPPPPEVLDAARSLRYRDFLTVCVIVDAPDLFPDNWIYVHDPGVRMGRLQNFKNWSRHMVPDPAKTSLGAEFFVSVGDDLWEMSDDDLVALTADELERLRLIPAGSVEDGVVYRQRMAYPIYDDSYRDRVETLARFVDGIENLQTIGRNGLHRYNNQDHAMLTALYAVDNLHGGDRDVWSVNADPYYHEEAVEES